MNKLRILVLSLATLSIGTALAEDTVGDGLRYVDLTPTFVTNYGYAGDGRLSYVRTDVTIQVHSQAAENAVIYHTPALRSLLVLALSRQDEQGILSNDGRDLIRSEVLESIRGFLKEEEGETFVDELLFTNFIVQQ